MVLKRIIGFVDHISSKIQSYIIIIACILVTSFILISAILRYVFKADFYGSEELILITAFWLYFTGSASSARDNTHINADMVTLFTKNKKYIRIVSYIRLLINMAVVCCAVMWGIDWLKWSNEINGSSPVFKIPNIIAQIPIVLSFVCWLLYLIRDFILLVREGRGKS